MDTGTVGGAGGCPGPSRCHPTIAGYTTRADARARDGRQHRVLLWFPGMMGISEWERQASGLRESLPGSYSSASLRHRARAGRLIPLRAPGAQGLLPRIVDSLASSDE